MGGRGGGGRAGRHGRQDHLLEGQAVAQGHGHGHGHGGQDNLLEGQAVAQGQGYGHGGQGHFLEGIAVGWECDSRCQLKAINMCKLFKSTSYWAIIWVAQQEID